MIRLGHTCVQFYSNYLSQNHKERRAHWEMGVRHRLVIIRKGTLHRTPNPDLALSPRRLIGQSKPAGDLSSRPAPFRWVVIDDNKGSVSMESL